jgi:DNA-binding transcriptional regulator GbsR (MarR family)
MGNGNKDYLVTKTDISIYKCLIKNKKLCQKELSKETGLTETSISRRLGKISKFKFLNKEKLDGKNQNNYSIKNGFSIKVKNMIELLTD